MSSEENSKSENPTGPLSNAEESAKTESNSESQNSSLSSGKTETNKFENTKVKTTVEEKLTRKMFIYARETICFFLAVAFTALAALHSSPPRISKPPLAKPFFNESSLVLDYYKGHLNALIDRVADSDFSFVMYYAPWDADCQAMKEELENVAQYYHSKVFFAAINCWHPGSECRNRYNKIQSYPVLMLYPSRESGIQYKGIRTAPYIIRFISTVISPIKRINNDEQLMELLKSYDAVMIGYFNFFGLKRSPGFNEFYKTALRSLERDPNGEIVFVVITSPELSNSHGVTQFPAASLLMWNETLFYEDSKEWTVDNLSNWINNVVHRVVTWLQPPGSKSLTFAPYLWDGPVLFLFTPRNPLHLENDNYNLLREIGLQYYDCSDNAQINDLVLRLRQSRVEAAIKSYKNRERCMNILEETKYQRSSFIEMKFNKSREHHQSNETPKCCSDIPTNKCVACATKRTIDTMCAASGITSCFGTDIFSLPFFFDYDRVKEEFTYTEARNRGYYSTESCDTVDKHIDPQSSLAVKKAFEKEECRRFLAGYSYQRPVFPRDFEQEDEVELTDAICKVNKTLALVAIDSLYYFHFAEALGVDVTNSSDKTVAVILDPADESQFVLHDELTRNSLVQFINNFTFGYLRRTMRSINPKRFVGSFTVKNKCKEKEICVTELTTETFLDTVLDSKKDVVVMYHSPYCAFCSAVSYVFLTVAHYFSKMDHLEFVRIDGDNNDLPWQYTMNRYPSILFFPAKRKEDSTLFPWTLPISVGNLLNFVLANLDAESHIEALINLCALGIGESPAACLIRTRYLCLDVLEEYLQDFRKLNRIKANERTRSVTNHRRRILLLKLEHLKDVHLILGTSSDLTQDKNRVQIMRNKFKKFYHKLSNLHQDDNENEDTLKK